MTCEVTTRTHPKKDHEEMDTGDAEFNVPRTKRKVENAQAVSRENHKEHEHHKRNRSNTSPSGIVN